MCACSVSPVRPRTVILRHAFTPADNVRLANLCGVLDEHLRDIERAFGVTLTRRHEHFRIDGDKAAAEAALAALQDLYEGAQRPIDDQALQQALRRPVPAVTPEAAAADVPPAAPAIALHTRRHRGRPVNPRVNLHRHSSPS